MKAFLLLCAGTCFLFTPLFSQTYPRLRWQKFFGKNGDDAATCIVVSSDGYLLLGGNVQENNGTGECTNMWVVKVDTNGKMIWEREIGGSGCDELRSMTPTPDGGVIFAGISNSFIDHYEKGEEAFQGDYFTGKLDIEGNISWLTGLGGLDVDQAYTVCPITGGYIVAGASNSHSFDVETDKMMTNMFVGRINGNGEKQATYVFGGRKHDWANSSWQCRNGDVVLVGFTDSEDIDNTQRRENGDGWVIRLDRFGNVKWQNVFSGKFEDFFTDVCEDKEGRIVLVGNFESEDKSKQFWMLKVSADGKRVAERIFGDRQDEFLTGVCPAGDGGVMLTGFSSYNALDNEYIKGGEDLWLIRLDNRSNIVWRTSFGGPDDERGVDVVEYRPGVFYCIGTKRNDFINYGSFDRKKDFWLLRIADEPCENIDVQVYLGLKNYTAYVNRSFKCKAITMAQSFIWDFGDGTTSLEKEPNHTYTQAGVYEMKLTVFLNENCSRTFKLPQLIMVW